MFQDFKKSASNIAIGIVVATIATGCASSRPGGLSDEELLGDVQFDPAKEVEIIETPSASNTGIQKPTQENHTHPHVPAEQEIIRKQAEKAELAFKDGVWEITQRCEELKGIYSAEGKERNQAKLEAEREELFSRRIKPSKRKKKMAPFLEHLDGHEAELTRIAAAIKACLLYTSPSPRDRG